jgi:hypothetical protein
MVASRTTAYSKSSHRRLYDAAAGGSWGAATRVDGAGGLAGGVPLLVDGLRRDVGRVSKPLFDPYVKLRQTCTGTRLIVWKHGVIRCGKKSAVPLLRALRRVGEAYTKT